MYIKAEFIPASNNNDFEPGFGRPKPAEWNEPLPLSLAKCPEFMDVFGSCVHLQ